MPRHLLIASLLYVICRGAMAALAPLYETGAARFASPLLMLLFVAIAVLFMRRVSWAWRLMQWVAVTEIALNALFFPSAKYHGVYTTAAQVIIAAVMASSCVILWSTVRSAKTKSWFVRNAA